MADTTGLTRKQREALALIARFPDGDAVITHSATWHDPYNAWINGATAQALERRGLAVVDRSDSECWIVCPADKASSGNASTLDPESHPM